MPGIQQQKIVKYVVSPDAADRHGYFVFQQGFEIPIANFSDIETAEKYALRLAETKPNWTVDTYDKAGILIGTYNSEDDSMPKPVLDSGAIP